MIGCVRHVPLLGGWLDDPTLPERRPLSTLCERPLRPAHRIFVAKAVLGVPTTRALIERLGVDKSLRRILGWERRSQVPSEATFSRAFAESAQSDLPDNMHVALSESISSSLGTAVISFHFASVAICSNTMRCSQPHALTMCRGDLPLDLSNDRRSTLPSIAITP